MVYVASPYSHYLPAVREARYLAVRNYVHQEIIKGRCLFSPILYAHRMAGELGVPTTAADWWTFNRQMIRSSSRMEVLTLDGWNESVGVTQELEEAARSLIPITLVEYTFDADL